MRNKLKWTFYLRLTISLALITWFVVAFDWRQISGILQKVQTQWLSIALIWIIAAVLVSTLKWQIILQAQGLELSFKKLWHIYWMGLFFNNFLPSSIGGDALRILWVGKAMQDQPGATASVVLERILATTALAMVGIVGCLVVLNPWREIIMMFLTLIFITILLLLLITLGRLPDFILKRKNRFTQFLIGITEHGRKVKKHPKAIVSALFWSVVFQLCVVGTNYAIFRSLNLVSISWVKSLYVVPATSVAAMLPAGINGYGIREGAYVLLLRPYNVPEAGAFTASILFAFLVSVCSLWGGWVWLKKR
ncbi:MAG: lysylphosphatidylglycerol synthase transmembrane domain-containing protein [Desulfitobacteriaceae bacterium]